MTRPASGSPDAACRLTTGETDLNRGLHMLDCTMPPTATGPRAWSSQEDEKIRDGWRVGLSARQIADGLSNRSRNAVIGRVHRLGIAANAPRLTSPSKRQIEAASRKTPLMQRARKRRSVDRVTAMLGSKPAPVVAPDLPPLVASFVDLEDHQCKWLPGEPSGPVCGRHKLPGLPYCEGHARRAYRSVEPTEPTSEPTMTGFAMPRHRTMVTV